MLVKLWSCAVVKGRNSSFLQKLAARVVSVIFPQAGIKAIPIEGISRIPEEVSTCEHVSMCAWVGAVHVNVVCVHVLGAIYSEVCGVLNILIHAV